MSNSTPQTSFPMIDRRHLILTGSAAALLPQAAAARSVEVGLIFAGQNTCPYCQYIAQVLAPLRHQGLSVLYAAMDRAPLPPFYEFQDGSMHPLTASLTAVPSIMVVNTRLDAITHRIEGFRSPRHFILRLSTAIQQSRAL